MRGAGIRQARPSDAPALARLYLSERPGLDWLGPETALALAETLIDRHMVRVATVERAVAGYIGWGDGVVRHLFIDPALRGQGLGTRLLVEAKAVSDGRLLLHVPASNHRARAFYRRHGFREEGSVAEDEQEAFIRLCWVREEQEGSKS
ncbi:GNAT family N-acetyltransferase [Acetobacteraceae bacterium H6797]|nr:GNAT family N-acetyltransferase [Acetobacteraceae bacterium H6797]